MCIDSAASNAFFLRFKPLGRSWCQEPVNSQMSFCGSYPESQAQAPEGDVDSDERCPGCPQCNPSDKSHCK